MPSEKDLDIALASALTSDADFRTWFASQLPDGGGYSKLVRCRADHPWGKVHAILPNQSTGALEAVDKECETDVLVVLENDAGSRLGIHIENKLSNGLFTPFQPELYAARADQWVGRDAYGSYHRWVTVLAAPESFLRRNADDARKFTVRLSHELLADRVPAFAKRGDA